MARLTTRTRKSLPKSDFGLPAKKNSKNKAGRGAYPMPDKANKILGKGKKKK